MHLGFSGLLAGAAVAGLDKDAREYCPPYWNSSLPYYDSAARAVGELAAADPRLAGLGDALAAFASPRAAYHHVSEGLEQAVRWGAVPDDLVRRAAAMEEKIRQVYFSAPADRLLPQRSAGPESAHPTGKLHVVIPFRAREDDLRLRNVLACLRALRTQSGARSDFFVTLVESDEIPRHAECLSPWVDEYVFQRQSGPFNKSASLNLGARQTRHSAATLCLLDADMVVDRDFVRRIRQKARRVSAFLPFHDSFSLDAQSSDRITQNISEGRDPYGETLSGYLLRRPPGGCVVVSAERFRAVGGFDSSYVGWGGEDRDFITRLESRGPVLRTDDTLLHLMHERPPMANAAARATHDTDKPTQEKEDTDMPTQVKDEEIRRIAG
ncbi:galactosyltransferase-related protein [Streptomyces varsoviensis]|uniref:glycosyltransferase n=1 Tax=Streptomyces varsoviensis TaxID=67373 RepID=UPI0033CEC760